MLPLLCFSFKIKSGISQPAMFSTAVAILMEHLPTESTTYLLISPQAYSA